jgi:hypothetical protein
VKKIRGKSEFPVEISTLPVISPVYNTGWKEGSEKIKLDKHSEQGVRSRPDIHFIPFAVTKFGALNGHATVFLTELGMHVVAS